MSETEIHVNDVLKRHRFFWSWGWTHRGPGIAIYGLGLVSLSWFADRSPLTSLNLQLDWNLD